MDEDVQVPLPYELVKEKILSAGDCDFSLSNSAIPGLSSQSRADVDVIRQTFVLMHVLRTVLSLLAKEYHKANFEKLSTDARQVLVQQELAPESMPFVSLESRTSRAEMENVLLGEMSGVCTVDWGPRHGLVANLLSPASLALIVWLGNRYGAPLLDMSFAFAKDYQSFSIAWLKCPVDLKGLDLRAVQSRAAKLRASPQVNSPGAAICQLAKAAVETLFDVALSIYHASQGRPGPDLFSKALDTATVHISTVSMSEARQYRDCSTPSEPKPGQKRPYGTPGAGSSKDRAPPRPQVYRLKTRQDINVTEASAI